MHRYKIEAATAQHLGDQKEQGDRVAIFSAPKAPGYVMAVIADGMGISSKEALAADQVIHTARQAFELFSPQTGDVPSLLATVIREAHTLIRLGTLSAKSETGSTMAVLVLTPQQEAFWTHIGNSRLYRFAGPNFAEYTSISLPPTLLAGQSRRSESGLTSPAGSCLGLGNSIGESEITLGRRTRLKAGDAFLLCTDGFWPYVDKAELGAAIAMNTPRQACEMLLAKARERADGTVADNCSLIVVKLGPLPKESKGYSVGKIRRAV